MLITGGTGFLGSAVQRALTPLEPAEVFTPTSAECDLRDRAATDALFAETGPNLVIHLAARVGGIGANRERPGDLYLDNLLIGTHVVDAARRHEVDKTVAVGTICSYPKITPVPFQESSLWTGYPEETNAPYGVAKLAMLTQIQANADQYGQKAIYLLPTNLYGPGDKFNPKVSHVIPALIRRMVEAKESEAPFIEVWGTGAATREFLYVDDAADGIVAAAERYDGIEPVNLGSDHELPISELVPMVAELVGYSGEIRWDTSKPDGQPRRGVDAGRAKKLFGWAATTEFRDGLQRTIEWFLANRELAEARAN
ncbi:MAG: GDP-L-fucose synthase [Microthrixaceae bacterium]|nr:GDP-L-fucose synthase [Microthrixaceae bacterium]